MRKVLLAPLLCAACIGGGAGNGAAKNTSFPITITISKTFIVDQGKTTNAKFQVPKQYTPGENFAGVVRFVVFDAKLPKRLSHETKVRQVSYVVSDNQPLWSRRLASYARGETKIKTGTFSSAFGLWATAGVAFPKGYRRIVREEIELVSGSEVQPVVILQAEFNTDANEINVEIVWPQPMAFASDGEERFVTMSPLEKMPARNRQEAKMGGE
ncbi:MAG TPA: hypothetical protein VNG29_04440 [Candidatus Paceibacterota bacterium]|nr:hypothetical protein [Candidatus Paceibacterota bacterium]